MSDPFNIFREIFSGPRCDGCSRVYDRDQVRPLVVKLDGVSGADKHFCSWRCLESYAAPKADTERNSASLEFYAQAH
jgi:hypothetical protein